MNPTIRPARLDDAAAIESFTENTWPEHGGDYVPRVFESWVRNDDRDERTLVAAVDGRAVGLVRTVLLSPTEAWSGGMRVHPDYRGEGIARDLSRAAFDWARERGASVARCMVFSWNAAGLGAARAAGYEPATEFRWAHPEPSGGRIPDSDHDPPDGRAVRDGRATRDERAADELADAAWRFWEGSRTMEHLGGLALDPGEPWALSSLTHERLDDAAAEDRLLVVGGDGERGARGVVHGVEVGGVDGFAVRVRVTERESNDDAPPERWAEYGVADWRDAEAAGSVFDAVARDAAALSVDRTRVLIPETVRAVSDAALARVEVSDSPDFVLAADLTERE